MWVHWNGRRRPGSEAVELGGSEKISQHVGQRETEGGGAGRPAGNAARTDQWGQPTERGCETSATWADAEDSKKLLRGRGRRVPHPKHLPWSLWNRNQLNKPASCNLGSCRPNKIWKLNEINSATSAKRAATPCKWIFIICSYRSDNLTQRKHSVKNQKKS